MYASQRNNVLQPAAADLILNRKKWIKHNKQHIHEKDNNINSSKEQLHHQQYGR